MAITPAFRFFAHLFCLAAFGAAAALGGCSLFRSEPGGVLTVSSADGSKTFAPGLTTGAYIATDADTADVYLSDLPHERFTASRAPLAGSTGNIIHIHIFLVPDAGSTPIDATACNFTMRHIVLSGGGSAVPVLGMYAGGGFLTPSGTLGSGTITGSVSAASQRLSRATPGFTDLLGAAIVNGKFSAPNDEELAKAMSGRFEELVSLLPSAKEQADDAKPAAAPVKKGKKKGKGEEKTEKSKDGGGE